MSCFDKIERHEGYFIQEIHVNLEQIYGVLIFSNLYVVATQSSIFLCDQSK